MNHVNLVLYNLNLKTEIDKCCNELLPVPTEQMNTTKNVIVNKFNLLDYQTTQLTLVTLVKHDVDASSDWRML